MAEIQALREPLEAALQEGFIDIFRTRKGYVALLMNLEASFGVSGEGKNFKEVSVFQDKRLNFVRGQPIVTGVDWNNNDVTGLVSPLKKATDSYAGVFRDASAYAMPSEVVSEGLVSKMETDEATADYLDEIKTGILDAYDIALEEDLNPTSFELSPTMAGGINGENTMEKVLALFHCFQSGYAGNSQTPDSSGYSYLGINLNDPRNLTAKALVVGQGPTNQQAGLGIASIPFGVPSNDNLRSKIYFPMDDRKVAPEDLTLAFTDQNVYNYLVNDPESRELKFGMKAMETFSYGGMYRILPNRVMVSYLSNLQKLYTNTGVHKMLFAPREELYWGQKPPRIDMLPIVGGPGYQNLQAIGFFRHMVRNPRRGALAYNITLQ